MNMKVLLRKKNEVLSNRAGNAPNKKVVTLFDKRYEGLFCILPFVQFNVNPDGLATICCYDAYYENVIGDVRKEGIL